jgi:hypothetical protein
MQWCGLRACGYTGDIALKRPLEMAVMGGGESCGLKVGRITGLIGGKSCRQ